MQVSRQTLLLRHFDGSARAIPCPPQRAARSAAVDTDGEALDWNIERRPAHVDPRQILRRVVLRVPLSQKAFLQSEMSFETIC